MASTFSILIIALVVSVQGTLAAHAPLDFLENLNGTQKGEKGECFGQLKKYLAKLGYIDPATTTTNSASSYDHDDIFDDALEQGLTKYQHFYKLRATGTLDWQTLASLHKPRCGVSDIQLSHNSSSFGDMKYTFTGSKWASDKRNLTVSFPDGTRVDAFYPVNQALHKWADVSGFIFTWVSDVEASDVKMSFKAGDHGDGSPFHGPFGAVAHAADPGDPTNVYIHFDADENWGTKSNTEKGKIDLHSVALHELGHVLGLDHSQDPNSIMHSGIHDGERKDLNQDDIRGIQALYN